LPLPVPKPYVDHEREMAAKVKHIESMREKKKRDAAATQAIIDKELDDLNALADLVLDGQRRLPLDDVASSTAALAAIAIMAQCTPIEALTCPTHGTCTCLQPEQPAPRLVCVGQATTPHDGEEAACIGTEAGATDPGCNLCCEHEGDVCRPVTEDDQPKPVVPTTAPEVKAVDCPLHGVESKHGPAVAPAEPALPTWWRCTACGDEFDQDRSSHAAHAQGCDGSCKKCPVECGPIVKQEGGFRGAPPLPEEAEALAAEFPPDPAEPPTPVRGVKAGDEVTILGFKCKVVRTGDPCEEEGCERPTVTIIDPEGAEDTVHLSDCEGLDIPADPAVTEVPLGPKE